MSTAVEILPVAKGKRHGGERPGAGRPKAGRDDVSAKIDRGVVAKAQYLARLKGLTLAEFLTETVRPIVDRDFAKATAPASTKPKRARPSGPSTPSDAEGGEA